MKEDERQRTRETIREMVRNTIDVLGAVKDEVDEAIDELRRREDVSPEGARSAVRDAMRRAQEAMGDARERLDFVPRREFESLEAEVAELRRRVSDLEGGGETRRIPVENE